VLVCVCVDVRVCVGAWVPAVCRAWNGVQSMRPRSATARSFNPTRPLGQSLRTGGRPETRAGSRSGARSARRARPGTPDKAEAQPGPQKRLNLLAEAIHFDSDDVRADLAVSAERARARKAKSINRNQDSRVWIRAIQSGEERRAKYTEVMVKVEPLGTHVEEDDEDVAEAAQRHQRERVQKRIEAARDTEERFWHGRHRSAFTGGSSRRGPIRGDVAGHQPTAHPGSPGSAEPGPLSARAGALWVPFGSNCVVPSHDSQHLLGLAAKPFCKTPGDPEGRPEGQTSLCDARAARALDLWLSMSRR
jgi:hypothetical protein